MAEVRASTASADGEEVRPPPWEERSKHGVLTALWLTWRDSVFRPVPFFRHVPARRGKKSALGYAVIVAVVGLVFAAYWRMIEAIIAGEPALRLISLEEAVVGLLWSILLLAAGVATLLVGAGAIHLFLSGLGGAGRGYEGTVRALAYSAGPAAFTVIPFLGPLLGSVWVAVLVVISLREVQRTTTLRVLGALCLVILMLGALVVVASLVLLGGLERGVET